MIGNHGTTLRLALVLIVHTPLNSEDSSSQPVLPMVLRDLHWLVQHLEYYHVANAEANHELLKVNSTTKGGTPAWEVIMSLVSLPERAAQEITRSTPHACAFDGAALAGGHS